MINELDQRKAKTAVLVETVYQDAVNDFVSGNYATAVREFQNVLAVSPNYKDVKDYMKKANFELKILKLYQ